MSKATKDDAPATRNVMGKWVVYTPNDVERGEVVYGVDAESFFLDWFNNYLTVSRIAEDYGISEEIASKLIDSGKAINNKMLSVMDRQGKIK